MPLTASISLDLRDNGRREINPLPRAMVRCGLPRGPPRRGLRTPVCSPVLCARRWRAPAAGCRWPTAHWAAGWPAAAGTAAAAAATRTSAAGSGCSSQTGDSTAGGGGEGRTDWAQHGAGVRAGPTWDTARGGGEGRTAAWQI